MKRDVFPIETVIATLEQEVVDYAVPVVDLIAAQTKDPLKVLLATILSARTKDEVTAATAKRLFARADSLEALEDLSLEELEKIFYPVGFFRNKARYLAELPAVLKKNLMGRFLIRLRSW